MIFNQSEVDKQSLEKTTLRPSDNQEWKLGILNLRPKIKDKGSEPFPAQHFKDQNAFDRIFSLHHTTVEKIEVNQP